MELKGNWRQRQEQDQRGREACAYWSGRREPAAHWPEQVRARTDLRSTTTRLEQGRHVRLGRAVAHSGGSALDRSRVGTYRSEVR